MNEHRKGARPRPAKGPRERIRLRIASIAPGGDGVAHVERADGRRAVFVAKAAPGDVLEAEVDFTVRPARGSLSRLVEPSPVRVAPPCRLAARCGGCDLMHLTLDAQRAARADFVRAALERALPGVPVPIAAAHRSPLDRGYRGRARLAVLAGRGRAAVGYRQTDSHFVEDVDACLVLDPRLDAVLPLLHRLFAAEQGEGEVAIALGAEGRPVLDVHWSGELSGRFFGSMGEAVDGGALAGAEVWLEGAREPARSGDPRGATIGADGEPLWVPSGGFAQSHAAMNGELGARALAQIPADRAVVELFAGSGNFTVALARAAASLVAVESDPRAAEAARENLRARGLAARVVQADADAFELPPGTRTVLLDPPRSGAPGAAARLARSKVRRVVYVSCDSATLARDAATLAGGGFRLTSVELFEMFPHTSHVEVLAVFDRPRDQRGTLP